MQKSLSKQTTADRKRNELSMEPCKRNDEFSMATEGNVPLGIDSKTENLSVSATEEIIVEVDHDSAKQFEPDFNPLKLNECHCTSNREKVVPAVCVPRFVLNGNIVIIFTDACQAVLKIWGSYSNLQHLLRKHRINTHRFNQLELRKLKSTGTVDMQVKVCSFITDKDFPQIIMKYDEIYNTDKAKFIQFLTPVEISDNHSAANVQGVQSSKGNDNTSDITRPLKNTISLHRIHVYMIQNQEVLTLSEVNSFFATHFKRPNLLLQFLSTLEISVSMLMYNRLKNVQIHSAITDSNCTKLFIKSKDFDRILQHTTAFLNQNPPEIAWICSNESLLPSEGEVSQGSNSVARCDEQKAVELLHKSGDCIENFKLGDCQTANTADAPRASSPSGLVKKDELGTTGCDNLSDVQHVAPQSGSSPTSQGTCTNCCRYIIRTCCVNDEVVVCIPDLQKAVIDIFKQCAQVGNYMHRLTIPTRRFERVFLKPLKSHHILSSRATLCTYITKSDAERLLQMYSANHGDVRYNILHKVEFSEPINLGDAVNNVSGDNQMHLVENGSQETLKIPMFFVNDQIVVSMPDVHKAVQLLNGQCVQLQYNLDKLGIVKYKYSYNDICQLKVLTQMKMPSLCTFITKSDVDKVLKFYVTPENETRLQLIEWQSPTAVESVACSSASDAISSADAEFINVENNDENAADSETCEVYSISDLYKAFVSDDTESMESINDDDDLPETLFHPSTSSPSSSISLAKLPQSVPIAFYTNDKVRSPNNQLQPRRAIFSNNPSPPMHLPGRYDRDVDQAALNVNQSKQVINGHVMDMTGCWSCDTTLSCSKIHPTNIVGNSAVTTCSSIHSTISSDGGGRETIPGAPVKFTNDDSIHHSCKRPRGVLFSDGIWIEQLVKKCRDHDDLLKTLQRKETEMNILYDAYQEQIQQERGQRLAVQRELDQVKNSNAELLENIERKELEMKILHDSYKLQMDLQRKKREQLEIELLNLRAGDARISVLHVKEEPL
ncbi:uncharacterized protein LOC111328426 isoform X2 [Stylophora pistillata]|uniref:uncharacterized protein LOC111328426 isoform X2 n=1 Tax=Stylophora pistillata TaxID=50429 RepID=UPI000C03D15D|nr:uncharacterized protein LOC111328426 isoform X2 [Stylophora pistillata]